MTNMILNSAGNPYTKPMRNMVEELNIPVTDADFRSLLKEIEPSDHNSLFIII